MFYLAAQIWLHLGLAFLMGGGAVWWYLRRAQTDQPGDIHPAEEPQALLEQLTGDNARLKLKMTELAGELEVQTQAAEEAKHRLAAAESEVMDSATARERLAAEAAAGEGALAAARSELQHAREELRHKTDELAHRRAEWTLETEAQREDIENLRGQLRRRRSTSPRTPRLEPRLPEQLVLEDRGAGNQGPEDRALESGIGEHRGAAPDDLTRIKGIGRVLAGLLNEMGIHTFGEIAAWTVGDIERIQASLPQFPGRIRRDDWVSQAADLDQTSRV